jgi:hypothetical protein
LVYTFGAGLDVLLHLDQRQRMAQTFVLDDCSMVYTPILAEDPLGKHLSFPAHLQASISEVVEIDILAAQLL